MRLSCVVKHRDRSAVHRAAIAWVMMPTSSPRALPLLISVRTPERTTVPLSRAKLSTIGPPERPLGVGDTAETPVDVLTFRRLGCRNPIMPGAAGAATFVYTRGAGRSVF